MYNGEHAVIFGPLNGSAGKNTWDDWYLIPTSRPTMAIPGTQSKFIEVYGMSGSLDATNYLTNNIVYMDRTGSFEFLVDNDHASWTSIRDSIESYLHGKRLRMTLADDDEWYYEGRFTFDEFKSDEKNSRVVISYRVAPFKISIYPDFVENILWDPFCFERDYDWSVLWHLQSTSTTQTFDIPAYGAAVTVAVRLVSGGPVTASFGGVTKQISTVGSTQSLGQSMQTGLTTLSLTGNGVVDIGWKKISL